MSIDLVLWLYFAGFIPTFCLYEPAHGWKAALVFGVTFPISMPVLLALMIGKNLATRF